MKSLIECRSASNVVVLCVRLESDVLLLASATHRWGGKKKKNVGDGSARIFRMT